MKNGWIPLIVLTLSVEIVALIVCDVEKKAVLKDDGNGTTPLIELTRKSEIFASMLLNVEANKISYDDMKGARPLMLLTLSAFTEPLVAVRMPVFVKMDESVVAWTIDVDISVVDVIVTLINRAWIVSAISCPVLITFAVIEDVCRLL